MEDIHYLLTNNARHNAKASNTGFKVGAYLEAKIPNPKVLDTIIFASGNIEHPNSGLNICAERMVLSQALGCSANPSPTHLYLVSDSKEPIFPCGVCRQYMSIWPKLKVTVYSSDGQKKITKTASQLLPNPYRRARM